MNKYFLILTILCTLFIPTSLPGEAANDTWLIMLYQDADDYQLEEDIFIDMNEAENVGSTKKVTIVSQCDRYVDGFAGDGDWNGTRRFILEKDTDIFNATSKATDIGEQNMADGKTLVDFAVWAIKAYPAKKHVLILSDHGMGWPGGWTDPDPDEGDMMWMFEIAQAFKEIIKKTGIGKFEIIGFDACLMGHVEVFSSIAPYAKYAVASQETEPGIGWAYSGFLDGLIKNPKMNGAELASLIVSSYIDLDASIMNPALRNRMGGEISIEAARDWMSNDITLSAIDLAEFRKVEQSLNDLTKVLHLGKQEVIAKARSYAQSYTNIFGESYPPSYIDLGHFAKLLIRESKNKKITAACETLLKAIKTSVIAEKHGSSKPGSMGISIYFPNSELYKADWGGAESYAFAVPDFVKTSGWDDFLLSHYTGKETGEDVIAIPEKDDIIIAPGKGEITISGITLSKEKIKSGELVDMDAIIKGQNIAYIYIFVGYYDEESDSFLIADKDFIEADGTKEIDGIYYPDWSDQSKIEMEFEWDSILFSLTDGKKDLFCLLEPANYGKTADDAVYYVEGIYSTADGKDSRYAQMYMDADGQIMIIYGFTGIESGGAPHEIKPKKGDSFTILETWIEIDDKGNTINVQEQGGTLTFGKNPVEWYDFDAYPGAYVIGFIVEDFDGNVFEEYTSLEVVE